MTEPVTRLRPGASVDVDRRGHPVPGPDVETTIVRCLFAPSTTTETPEVGRDSVVTLDTVYAPPGTDITSADRVRVRDVVRTVQGTPARWVGPDGRERGLVVQLENIEG